MAPKLPTIVSLFSGAGGLDLGFRQAGYNIAFALDLSDAAISTHKLNFPETNSVAADLVKLGPDNTVRLIREAVPDGAEIAVIGGPPCQAFSRSNPGAAVDDPRNQLPQLYLDIVEKLQAYYTVTFVMFENVLGIRDSKHQETFNKILARLQTLGLLTDTSVYSALEFGVPQDRRRVILTAFANSEAKTRFSPKRENVTTRTVRDTIGNLPEPAFYSRGVDSSEFPHHPNHWTMRPLSPRFGSNSQQKTTRSFRRLRWDSHSPTVAYGHREIHVHPEGHRRLSILEAMLLQGFPESFVLEGTLSAQVEQVSNAVPPPMGRALAIATVAALRDEQDSNQEQETALT